MAYQNTVFDHKKLKAARERKFPGKSASSVARDVLDISPQRLHRYENGEDYPNPTMLARMCETYGVDLRQLMSRIAA